MAQSEKDKKDKGAAPPIGLADSPPTAAFSLERFEALQQTLSQIGESAAVASGSAGSGLTVGASLIAKVGLAVLVSLLGVGASQMALKHDRTVDQSPFLPAPGGVDKNGFNSANPSAMGPGDPNAGSELTPPTGFSMGSVPAQSDDQMVADAQKDYQKAVEAAKAASMAPGVPQAQHLTGAPSAFKTGLSGTAALQANGATTAAGAPGSAGGAAGMQAGLAKAMDAQRASYAAKLGGHSIGVHGGGRAFKQLYEASRRSGAGAHSTTGESGAHNAESAFGNNAGAGSPIGGGGLALGGAGVTNSKPPTNPSVPGPVPGGGGIAAPAAQPQHKNATPWQTYVDIAKYVLMAASGLLLAASILGWMSNASPDLHTRISYRLWAYRLAHVAMYLGIIVAVFGGLMLGMGQTTQGLIFTLSGALVGFLAYLCADGMKPPSNASGIVDATHASMSSTGTLNATWQNGLTTEQAGPTLQNLAAGVGPGTTFGAGVGGAAAGTGGAISSTATGGAKPS